MPRGSDGQRPVDLNKEFKGRHQAPSLYDIEISYPNTYLTSPAAPRCYCGYIDTKWVITLRIHSSQHSYQHKPRSPDMLSEFLLFKLHRLKPTLRHLVDNTVPLYGLEYGVTQPVFYQYLAA
jgi:hypothetical protein